MTGNICCAFFCAREELIFKNAEGVSSRLTDEQKKFYNIDAPLTYRILLQNMIQPSRLETKGKSVGKTNSGSQPQILKSHILC
jgi:hypothetical protein